MDTGLQGKIALVAAASKGLGYGVARALAGDGAHLSMCARTDADIQAAGARLRDETGVRVQAIACDVRDPASIRAWIDAAVAEYGQIDALLINGGGPPAGALMSFDDAAWQSAFESTLLSAVRLIRAVVPHMRDGGAILTVTSIAAVEPVPALGLSTVMRAGVAGLVKVLADELADRGIRLNNLMPGRIATDRVAQLDALTAQREGVSVEAARAASEARIPLRRLGTIDEFGAAAAFLLSPAAGYITGASLRVDGGVMRSI